jgi:hypothetical protein
MKLARLLAVAGVSLAALSLGHVGVTSVAEAAAPQALKADNFRLTSADLQSYELYPMADAKAVVIVTQANGDAAVRRAAADLKALKTAYAGKGVEFMMLNSSRTDERAAILAEAAQYDFAMPVLMDSTQLVGEQLNVTRSGEVIVLDPRTWRVAYRGPLGTAAQHWAADAVDAVIAGRAVATPSRPVQGQAIAFPERGKTAQHARISYAQTIAPLIEQKCVICHEEGGIGPMQFTSYEKIKGMAPMIREVLRTKRMPPFHADTTVTHFLDDQSLTNEQIATLTHWIEAGAPRGSGADPLAGKTHVAAEWPMGKPDVILNVPAYTIPANGVVDYQRPTTPYPVTEGRWLRAATFKVDQRQAVHHILTGYIANPRPGATTATESTWGATLGTYAVGTEWQPAPADVGTYLPAGGAIGFQNHYTPFGREVVANSKIGLYYYDTPPKYIMRSQVIVDPTINIPAGVERHVENAYLTFPKEALLYGAFIHAHYRGAGSKLEILYPDGRKELLISVPHYDFNWQRDYRFAQPVRVPAGSKLIATYVYDNSTRNPANPDARRVVPWGEQSFDEMLYTALSYRWMDETVEQPTQNDKLLQESRIIGMFDANLDNKVARDELNGQIGAFVKLMFPMLDRNGDGGLDTAEIAVVAAQFGGFSELPGG